MAFWFECTGSTLRVVLSGWDCLANGRRTVEFERADVVKAAVVERHELESRVDHRKLGIGTHFGWVYPGRRRIGTHLGRGVIGPQFWVTARSGPELPLLVLDLTDHEFARAVLAVSEPDVIETFLASNSSTGN